MATWQGSSQHHATRSALLLSACVLAAVMGTRWVRLNVSPSVPLGLYRLTSLPTPLRQGMLVVLPVPSTVQHWHSAWLPLLKPVAAVAGEEVCDRWGHLWVAGIWYGPIYPEADGTPLPHLDGCQIVPEGTVFLASPQPKSLDGRYFGMTPIADVTAQALPLLTWR